LTDNNFDKHRESNNNFFMIAVVEGAPHQAHGGAPSFTHRDPKKGLNNEK